MNKKLLATCVALSVAMPSFAEVNVYGKANISFQASDENDTETTKLVSNASRLGFKGSEKINDDLDVIYKAEFEVFFDDGDKGGKTFTQRNIYAGVKGDFGKVIGGNFDSPFKKAQNKIDLFNDLVGDIKNSITENDNRTQNTIAYMSPSLSGFAVAAAYIMNEDGRSSEINGTDVVDDGISASVSYTADMGLYVALAADHSVEEQGADAFRLVAQYNIDALQIGALYETYEEEGQDDVDGWVLSAQYKVSDTVALKAQLGESDIKAMGGEVLSIGADYKLSKASKVFAYFTTYENDANADLQYLGVGLEHKF